MDRRSVERSVFEVQNRSRQWSFLLETPARNIKQERDIMIERGTFFESKGHGSLRRRIRSIRHVPGLLELGESSAQARLMMLVSQIAGTFRRNASFREKQAKPGNKQKRTEDQHQR
jgi:hypothetical protein